MTVRRRVYEIVEVAERGDALSKWCDIFILSLIGLNVLGLILGTVDVIDSAVGGFLRGFEFVSLLCFTGEYLLRMWSCVENPRFARPITGRLRYAITPMALIDLLAIAPFFLPMLGVDLRSLRVFRLLRLARLAKVGRYFNALELIGRALRTRREELVVTCGLVGMLLIVAASLMYYAERDAQPEHFGSIPQAMWWAVVTLTTVGYGDVYPVTSAGHLLGGIVTILGIGIIAMPTGIISAALLEQIQAKQESCSSTNCPHCGKPMNGCGSKPTNETPSTVGHVLPPQRGDGL